MRVHRAQLQDSSINHDPSAIDFIRDNTIVYIVYHDDNSRIIAENFHNEVANKKWTKPVFIESTVFFESNMYRTVLPFTYLEDWKDKLYVGMISYKTTLVGPDRVSNFNPANILHNLVSLGSASNYSHHVIPFIIEDVSLLDHVSLL